MMMKSENEVKYENVATDEEPPACDHTQAIFIRDEKRAAVSQNELGLLGMGKSKSPNVYGIQYRAILLVYLMLASFFHIMVFSFSLSDGFKVTAASALVSAMLHITGFTALLLEKHMLLKAFLVSYTVHFVVNTVLAGYGMLVMWSPSFCRELASSVKGFSYQQCQNNLGSLRAMGSSMLIAQVAVEAGLLHMIRKVFEHDEMIENPKKQGSPKTTSMMLV